MNNELETLTTLDLIFTIMFKDFYSEMITIKSKFKHPY